MIAFLSSLDHRLLRALRADRLVAPPRQPFRAADDRRGFRQLPHTLSWTTQRRPVHDRTGARPVCRPCSSCTCSSPIRAAGSRAVRAGARRGRYVTAIGLQLVRMTFGGFGPHNLFEVRRTRGSATAVLRVQLVRGQRVLPGRSRRPRAAAAARGPAAAPLAGSARRRVRARARDDRLPLHLGRVRRSRSRRDPLGHLRDARARAARLPDRTAS